MMMISRALVSPAVAIAMPVLILCVFIISFLGSGSSRTQLSSSDVLCLPTFTESPPIFRDAILHYATSQQVPQQSAAEISITLNVIKNSDRPLKMLVFGLGHDSLMWASFNSPGTTIFLEEDEEWIKKILNQTSYLEAYHVAYRTQVNESQKLLSSYKSEPTCSLAGAYLKGNHRCKLALDALPDIVYDTEWDLIMIDAPQGWFPEAPGRMGAIFSAAVMARRRKEAHVTHVFVHDVDRPAEKTFAEEFLCKKYRVNGAGRLWHFEIPSLISGKVSGDTFC